MAQLKSSPITYILPSSPHYRCLDRFSISTEEEDDEGLVPFWSVVKPLLHQEASSIDHVIDNIDTIVTTRLGSCPELGNFSTLRDLLSSRTNFLTETWPKLAAVALDLPDYFPNGELSVLAPEKALDLSRGAVACLVIHQFLCTLNAPFNRESYYDFSIWYGPEQPHPKAAEMYLTALCHYLESLPSSSSLLQDSQVGGGGDEVTYKLHSGRLDFSETEALTNLEIQFLQEYDSSTQRQEVQGPNAAVVISANKLIGFGKSATQEEIYVGITPESCPAVLFTPTLTDDTVLVISGARSTLHVTGQRRNISWTRLPIPDGQESCSEWVSGWKGGTMLFMDALELDVAEDTGGNLADLKPHNLERDLRKAYIGFSSLSFRTVITGPWGCGAFGGDPAVKAIVLWMAASLAGVPTLKFQLDPSHYEIGEKLQRLIQAARGVTTGQLRALLSRVPMTKRRVEILDWLIDQIGK